MEMLIVMAIVVILVGLALPNIQRMRIQGNIVKAKGDLRVLQSATENYYIHHNNAYPVALSDLASATPRIVNTLPEDPFKTKDKFETLDYGYATSTNGSYYVIYSVGPGGDGKAEVADNGVVTETKPESCIYVSNAADDTVP